MKSTKSLVLLIIATIVTTFTLSSCFNENKDGYEQPTKEEQNTYQVAMSGLHGSVARFYYTKVVGYTVMTEKYDSIKHASWVVSNDSTVTFQDFPVCKLDSAIQVSESDKSTDATEALLLRDAISKSTNTMNMKSIYFIPYKNSTYITYDNYNVVIFPQYIQQELEYNGKKHTVYFVFTSGTQGVWNKNSEAFEYQMLLSAIAVDRFNPQTYDGNYVSNSYFRQVYINCLKK